MSSSGTHMLRTLALAAALWASSAPATAQQIVYIGSAQVASGDYIFTERTTSFFIVNGLELTFGPVRVSGTLPAIVQSTPWITYGVVPVPSGGRESAEVGNQIGRGRGSGSGSGTGATGRTVVVLPIEELAYQTGIGDPLVRGDVEIVSDVAARPSVRLHAAAKIPLRDPDSGFSTGEWDVGSGISLAKSAGRNSVFADVSYWRFGDPAGLELQDAVAYSAAYGRTLATGRWSLMASVSGWSTMIEGADPPVEVGLGVTRLVGAANRGVSLFANVGLTETAPDFSIALGWRVGLR
jgi:hypothetical protein